MASETGSSGQSPSTHEFMNSINTAIPFFFPFILGFNSSQEETHNQSTPGESRDRVVVVNPLTRSMLVIEGGGGSLGSESLFRDLSSQKGGPRPASKAAIDAMPSVEIVKCESDDEQCAICLAEWEVGETAREMPCKHRFHGNCIENWLKINGSCPICRYKMPVDEDEDSNRKLEEENGGERRGIWVSFNFGGDWRDDHNSANERSPNQQEGES